jgi:hypothetical protein
MYNAREAHIKHMMWSCGVYRQRVEEEYARGNFKMDRPFGAAEINSLKVGDCA